MRVSWGLLAFPAAASAIENGINGWLRYAPLPNNQRPPNLRLPGAIMAFSANKTSPVYTAGQELQAGIKSILNQTLPLYHEPREMVRVNHLDRYNRTISRRETCYNSG